VSQVERFKAELANPKLNGDKILALIKADHTLVDAVFNELSGHMPRVKFSCAKSILLLSEHDPSLLMSKLDQILKLLGSENRILKWNAIAIIGNMASADSVSRIRPVLPELHACLSGGELITANHAIAALAKIGCAHPGERKKIISKLLLIEHANFDTAECRNIAIGKVILALGKVVDPSNVPEEVIEFARRQAANTRKATAGKAESFLRRYDRAKAAVAGRG